MSGQTEVIDIPSCLVHKKIGFAMDIGGSVIKIAHTVDVGAGDLLRIHLVSFPKSKADEAFSYLAANIKPLLDPSMTYYSCGNAATEHSDRIYDVLGVRLSNTAEVTCFVDSFQFLTKHLHPTSAFHPESSKVAKYSTKMYMDFNSVFKVWASYENGRSLLWKSVTPEHNPDIVKKAESLKEEPDDSKRPKIDPQPTQTDTESPSAEDTFTVHYPIMLCMCGSAAIPILVHEDGAYLIMDVITLVGKSFLGLGSLLTGAKTYDELMSLAEKGTPESLHLLGKHLKMTNDDDSDLYSHIPDYYECYMYGRVGDKQLADFKREDLAAGVLNNVAQSLSMNLHYACLAYGVKQAFFCGGFPGNSQLVRDEIGRYFEQKSLMNPLGIQTDSYFFKLGSYMGALGALLRTLQVKGHSKWT